MDQRLRALAAEWFAKPELIPGFESPRFARRCLRLWRYPAVRGSWTALFLYRTDPRLFAPRGMAPVSELTWDFQADSAQSSDREPVVQSPSIEVRHGLIPSEVCVRRIVELESLVFTPFSHSLGTDGVTSGVDAQLGSSNTSIPWWGSGPAGLEPLARWYEETWAEVRRHRPESAQSSTGAPGE